MFHLKRTILQLMNSRFLGKTGSGKSTILDLVARLYDSTEGEILIDETPIHQLNLKDLRGATGAVPQDAFLFSDTIANNIRFGKEDATPQEIEEAAQVIIKAVTKLRGGRNG